MDKILYCKNKPVYNLTTEEVYNMDLLPGLMQKNACTESFTKWMKCRYNAGTNTLARKLRGLSFGQGNREEINNTTHMLSYSDCYWIKDADDITKFEDVSPYYASFWNGDTEYKGEPIPTLYVGGALSKAWTEDGFLYKQGNLGIELECIDLCKKCGIPVEYGISCEDGILLANFTTPDVMLEQADASGRFDEENYTNKDIIREFGLFGVQMITIDAITGDGDRHLGNMAFLRDANTGAYIGPAPMYDFDQALQSTITNKMDILMREVVKITAPKYRKEILRICKIASKCKNEIFRKRANTIQKELENEIGVESDANER